MSSTLLRLFADAILIIHVLFVAFVVLGLFAVYLGYFLNWRWVRNRAFRIIHLCAIGYVVVQAWLGVVCPLTTWEMALRAERVRTPIRARLYNTGYIACSISLCQIGCLWWFIPCLAA